MASEVQIQIKIVGEREAGRSFTLRVRSHITVQKIARAVALRCCVPADHVVLYRQQALQPGSEPVDHRQRLADIGISSDGALECVIVDQVGMHECTVHPLNAACW